MPDSKSCRELTCPLAIPQLLIRTSGKLRSGTSALVEVTLVGNLGRTQPLPLTGTRFKVLCKLCATPALFRSGKRTIQRFNPSLSIVTPQMFLRHRS